MKVLDRLRRFIEQNRLLASGGMVVVGVSGGPDSLCLLHLLCRLRAEYDLGLHVAHLHHGLRGTEADADADFVRQLAADWELPCTIERADVPALARQHKLAIEEAARRARYAFLGRVARRAGAGTIAVGHNADDQAETVLMHFIRGSGLAGLRGMSPLTPLTDYRLLETPNSPITNLSRSKFRAQSGPQSASELLDCGPAGAILDLLNLPAPNLIRPLLEIPRADIEAYCDLHGLEPRFDRSNLDTTYFRNWLRHEAIPLLASHNPNVQQVFCRSARVIADDYALLRSLLAATWPRVVVEESPPLGPPRRGGGGQGGRPLPSPPRAGGTEGGQITFDLAAWRALPPGLQRATLREAVHRLRRSLRNINFVHVEEARTVARDGVTGDQATLPQGLMLTLGYDRFILADADEPPPLPNWPLLPPGSAPLPLRLPGRTPLPGSTWALEAEALARADLPPDWDANADPWRAFLDARALGEGLALRTRRPGDRFQPLGLDGHTVKLADFLTNQKTPRAARDRLPLLVSGEKQRMQGEQGMIWWVCGQRLDERARVGVETEQALVLCFVRL